MKISIRPFFTKVIVILMTFMVGLPCAVKKDFKEVLNIPVSDLGQAEKPNKSVVCSSFSKTESNNNSVSYKKKEIQKFDYKFGRIQYSSEVLYFIFSPFEDVEFTASIPIYILHEQYLI
ncbi:hypothetical protein AS589_16045 [Empedobacter brevis]|uniref:hypothetical protein n=1 Tax=Empedobacter brevis TaxID=247 RepID=UPI00131F99F0|nr:hypothetical protein [Empedobacter brevis]QHC86192.1 hypothetical protein AS589_16045 [Empedobacter brevis]